MRNSSTRKPTHKSMRGGRRNTEPPGEQVPDNGRNNAGEDQRQRYILFVDSFGYSGGYIEIGKDVQGNEIKKAAQRTAWKGVRTLVETTVAMEFAASWKPL